MIPESLPIIREISQPPFQGMVVRDSVVDRFLQGRGTVEDLILQSSLPVKKSKTTRTVILKVDLGSPGLESDFLFFKEYRLKNLIHALKPKFTRHRARIVWDLSWRLIACGIHVPEPSGYLLKQKGPFCLAGYSFSKLIPESHHLAAMAHRTKRLENGFDLTTLIESIAVQVALLHETGVIHGDLKWTNILVHESGTRFWFVDLDSARYCQRPPGPDAVAEDIARFVFGGMQVGVDDTLGERFLDTYANRRRLPPGLLAKPVEKLLDRLIKRHKFKVNEKR